MILIDASILMYAAGSDHANRQPATAVLNYVAEGSLEAGIDAEVLQEIIHRYTALGRWREGSRLYDTTRRIFADVYPVDAALMDVCKALIDKLPNLTARDGIHAAVVLQHRLEGICTFDTDFDQVPGCRRIDPRKVGRYRRPVS